MNFLTPLQTSILTRFNKILNMDVVFMQNQKFPIMDSKVMLSGKITSYRRKFNAEWKVPNMVAMFMPFEKFLFR